MVLDHVKKLFFTDSAVSTTPLSFDSAELTTLLYHNSAVPLTPLCHDLVMSSSIQNLNISANSLQGGDVWGKNQSFNISQDSPFNKIVCVFNISTCARLHISNSLNTEDIPENAFAAYLRYLIQHISNIVYLEISVPHLPTIQGYTVWIYLIYLDNPWLPYCTTSTR